VLTGGNDVCFGGRINASCQCDCYDGLFTGETCTGMVLSKDLKGKCLSCVHNAYTFIHTTCNNIIPQNHLVMKQQY